MSVNALNRVLRLINEKIACEMTAYTQCGRKGHIESFSQEELESLIERNDTSDSTPLKILLLGLVHLKRLDICTENSIKVYRPKRYY